MLEEGEGGVGASIFLLLLWLEWLEDGNNGGYMLLMRIVGRGDDNSGVNTSCCCCCDYCDFFCFIILSGCFKL